MTHTFAFLVQRSAGQWVAYTFPVGSADYVDWFTTRNTEHAAIVRAIGDGPRHHLLRFAHRVITCADYSPDEHADMCYHGGCSSAEVAAQFVYDNLKPLWQQEDEQ